MHGTCNSATGKCYCDLEWGGDDCGSKVTAKCINDCSGNGVCNLGKCYCNPGFSAKDCSKPDSCRRTALVPVSAGMASASATPASVARLVRTVCHAPTAALSVVFAWRVVACVRLATTVQTALASPQWRSPAPRGAVAMVNASWASASATQSSRALVVVSM